MGALDNFQYQKKQMKRSSAYLKKGTYVLHDNLRTYLHTGADLSVVNFPKGGKGKKNLLRRILGKALYRVTVPCDGKTFSADAVYFATVPNPQYKDIKFFDFSPENRRVLTLCANERRYDLYMKNRARVENRFPLPKLTYYDSEKLAYTEELVDGIAWQGSDREPAIYDALLAHYQKSYEANETEDFTPSAADCERLPDALKMQERFPVTLHHGDLSADNFKVSADGKLYFFDFDHANLFPLYYDVFFLMCNEAVINGNYTGTELFLQGAFDKYLGPGKYQYLKAFFHRFWLVRLEGIASPEHKEKYLNLYHKLIGAVK